MVRTIEVSEIFKYKPNAFKTYGIMAFLMTGYSSFAAYPYNTDDSLNTAWLYNFVWTFWTWGLTLFFWTQKYLFKSEGGAIHSWFVRMVNLGTINYLLVYWVIDIMVLRGTLDVTATTQDWIMWVGLIVLQIGTTVVQLYNKPTINFDLKMTEVDEHEFNPAEFEEEELEFLEPTFDNDTTSFSNAVADGVWTEDQISAYWGF